uniref:Uncharacterized protein n=1 Tax=Chromera velia CCMP2878 TaxID=1169474 RepID=A0A0G4FJ96_9ALVE|eukprot:Cvel_3384.t1-p1 / transcript=Cvel_3384.t1 / gene=Cvel_3384 / organism=Chromera_velia_CCMP2878 / gene_product=hypothetical protein / transcript_product=hypothetical protein / location=Cvel_scaffold136:45731-56194(-) / protein_length=464 / sequence_SO=supercontig / SO=protein_coding / is_pseudo=false
MRMWIGPELPSTGTVSQPPAEGVSSSSPPPQSNSLARLQLRNEGRIAATAFVSRQQQNAERGAGQREGHEGTELKVPLWRSSHRRERLKRAKANSLQARERERERLSLTPPTATTQQNAEIVGSPAVSTATALSQTGEQERPPSPSSSPSSAMEESDVVILPSANERAASPMQTPQVPSMQAQAQSPPLTMPTTPNGMPPMQMQMQMQTPPQASASPSPAQPQQSVSGSPYDASIEAQLQMVSAALQQQQAQYSDLLAQQRALLQQRVQNGQLQMKQYENVIAQAQTAKKMQTDMGAGNENFSKGAAAVFLPGAQLKVEEEGDRERNSQEWGDRDRRLPWTAWDERELEKQREKEEDRGASPAAFTEDAGEGGEEDTPSLEPVTLSEVENSVGLAYSVPPTSKVVSVTVSREDQDPAAAEYTPDRLESERVGNGMPDEVSLGQEESIDAEARVEAIGAGLVKSK